MKNILLVGHGYIGSYLNQDLTSKGYQVTACDHSIDQLSGADNTIHDSYQSLTSEDLAPFDTILWFAGHSSVPESVKDPTGALDNNCLNLFEFAKRKPANSRLIYASSASIYSVLHQSKDFIPPLLSENEARLTPVNPYDCSKVAFDALASGFLDNITGLRLGTVSGISPKLRQELIFNSMNIAAITDGIVRVANPHAYRSILFLSDLADYVENILESTITPPKILNVASINASVGQIATEIASVYQADIVELPNSQTYSFQMDCSNIKSFCSTPSSNSITNECLKFKENFRVIS